MNQVKDKNGKPYKVGDLFGYQANIFGSGMQQYQARIYEKDGQLVYDGVMPETPVRDGEGVNLGEAA